MSTEHPVLLESSRAAQAIFWIGLPLILGAIWGVAINLNLRPDGTREEPVACYVVAEPLPVAPKP